jgi:hypothetical protein
MQIASFVAKCAVCLAVLVAAFLALEGFALQFSDSARIVANLQQAAATGVLPATNYPMSPYGDAVLRFDMFSECTAFSTNLRNTDKPLLFRLAATPFIGPSSAHRCDPLRAALADAKTAADTPYFRYWHGYDIYLHPLLSYMSLQNIHRINALLLIGALAVLTARLVAWFGLLAAPAFLIPFALSSDLLTVPAVSAHTPFLVWVFASVAGFALLIERKAVTEPEALTLVFCLGAITNFFDVLYNPTLAPTLLAFLVLWQQMSRKPEPPTMRSAIAFAGGVVVSWFAGYILAWAAKWTFAAAILGIHVVVPDVINAMLFRIDGPVPGVSAEKLSFFTPLYSAFDQVGFALILICVAVAALFVAGYFIAGRLAKSDLISFALLQLPLTLPLLEAQILRNHTIIHAGFVSRTFVLFGVLPLLAALAVCRRPARFSKTFPGRASSKSFASIPSS